MSNDHLDSLQQRIAQIRAMPPGAKRHAAASRALTILQSRIESYRHFIAWPALIASLERDRDELISLQSPSASVGQSE